ncbi:hypothetical protein DB30_05479 [Enhygromyxa salina]|uniref:Uncharacterized protein n=1 Tax=Enhygromyxa salina TaxID=215803 RepID=A0A0C2CWY2_9BACT|nr:hypothetical protein DB30_05479 [Enhygromyxa salina]
MLASLDSAEQKIWEMTDASDRNAARFAASLAQLEKHKETVDSLLDELEVTRNLLAAEQARALEQERMLASERAKMARAGIGAEGFPASGNTSEDDPFADFDGEDLLDLGDVGDDPPAKPGKSAKPASVLSGKTPTRRPPAGVTAGQQRPTAQELDHALASLTDDDEDEGDRRHKAAARVAAEPDAPTARTRARSSSRARAAAASEPKPHDRSANRARLTVEAVDDDEWED